MNTRNAKLERTTDPEHQKPRVAFTPPGVLLLGWMPALIWMGALGSNQTAGEIRGVSSNRGAGGVVGQRESVRLKTGVGTALFPTRGSVGCSGLEFDLPFHGPGPDRHNTDGGDLFPADGLNHLITDDGGFGFETIRQMDG